MLFVTEKKFWKHLSINIFNIICLDKFNLINNVIFLLYLQIYLLLKTFKKSFLLI